MAVTAAMGDLAQNKGVSGLYRILLQLFLSREKWAEPTPP